MLTGSTGSTSAYRSKDVRQSDKQQTLRLNSPDPRSMDPYRREAGMVRALPHQNVHCSKGLTRRALLLQDAMADEIVGLLVHNLYPPTILFSAHQLMSILL